LRERVPLILLGYAAAVLVASLVITGVIWLPSLWRDIARADLGFPFFVLRVSLVAITAVSILPAVLAALLAERKGIRTARAYVGFGAAIGAAGLLAGAIFFTPLPGSGLAVAFALVAAGALGGLAYWWIAGRTAGLLRPAKALPATET
jgi:hypothetical protein